MTTSTYKFPKLHYFVDTVKNRHLFFKKNFWFGNFKNKWKEKQDKRSEVTSYQRRYTDKYIKGWLQSYVINGLKIKTIMRTTTHLPECLKSKIPTTPHPGEIWSKVNSHSCWWEYKIVQSLWKKLEISYKLEHRVTTWPSNLCPSLLPKYNENYEHAKYCTWVFTGGLFIIFKT